MNQPRARPGAFHLPLKGVEPDAQKGMARDRNQSLLPGGQARERGARKIVAGAEVAGQIGRRRRERGCGQQAGERDESPPARFRAGAPAEQRARQQQAQHRPAGIRGGQADRGHRRSQAVSQPVIRQEPEMQRGNEEHDGEKRSGRVAASESRRSALERWPHGVEPALVFRQPLFRRAPEARVARERLQRGPQRGRQGREQQRAQQLRRACEPHVFAAYGRVPRGENSQLRKSRQAAQRRIRRQRGKQGRGGKQAEKPNIRIASVPSCAHTAQRELDGLGHLKLEAR